MSHANRPDHVAAPHDLAALLSHCHGEESGGGRQSHVTGFCRRIHRSSWIHTFCRGRVATFKIPAYWKFVDDFPTTVTGKIQKFRMREMAVAELDLHGAASQETA